jgi:hypothetical protein
MMHIPTRRLALLAILVVGSAGGAAAYLMRQPAPRASTPFASAASTPPSALPPQASAVASAAPKPPAPASGTRAPHQQASSHVPDSAGRADSLFVDPAAVVASAPPWNSNSPPACGQWRSLLSDEQQTSYATALLRTAWTNEGSSGIPPENTAVAYRSAITAACLGKGKADDNVSDVAHLVYAAEPADWGP